MDTETCPWPASIGFSGPIRFSGAIPQIAGLMGPCIAGGAYLPTLSDFLLISRISGNIWLGGPRQTQAATSEKIDRNVGGETTTCSSGSCDVGADDERRAS